MQKPYFLPAIAQSAKVGFPLLFLALPNLLLSQQKHEVGLVAKAGIYTLPNQKTDNTYRNLGTYNTKKQQAGETYTIGLWSARRLSPYIRLSGELLYRHGVSDTEESYFSEYFDGIMKRSSNYKQNQRIQETSLSIPLKIQVSFRKNGKTSIALGGGLTRVLTANIRGKTESIADGSPTMLVEFPTMNSGWANFNIEKSLTAGLFHRLDNQTTLGLEYTFEQSSARLYDINLPALALIDCICFGYYLIPPRNVNSLSISLRHNLVGAAPKP